ncbi:hypothetical protein CC1G_03032 [Coprinopsis cinerea okayama7|uniref:DUF6533 domain-containing protein n=1 Tax=Coprinopsis cinerea (strain Okayama-7 / 130 / ATCC MYA-4618 / FGSC 9003) TaxID=240176 RepID=A8NS57_COPC7|nr:hypothetical protein CC1G_03032 [Coprinopsis cinerea okayama7\|eukprot:XP_001835944.1 hypothetical protein CC1G_03032 [Coprinopsis cinerea okayama7\
MAAPGGMPPLPASLDLPPHLSAHKYFLVCTLTVAAWDTLVLSPRTWRLFRSPGWPALKILFHFLRLFMPIEFIIVAVAFFDTTWTQEMCQKFYLFEPICTAFLLAAASAVHVIRINAIYDKNKGILGVMSLLFAIQVVVTAICCGFYRSVPLLEGQGCIAGPKANWVGIYWLAPTLLYTASFALALKRSIDSLQARPLSLWKLMLRDGLNLYGAIWIVNMANMLFWFIMKPTDDADPVKTIVTSMAAVLTTSMTLRIILSIRSSLDYGGSFALSNSNHGTSSRGNVTNPHIHGLSGLSHVSGNPGLRSGAAHITTNPHTYTLDEMRGKPEGGWDGADDLDKSSVGAESKGRVGNDDLVADEGVKITINREVIEEGYGRAK